MTGFGGTVTIKERLTKARNGNMNDSELEHNERIETPSMRYGRNHEARVPYESVILFRLESPCTR